MSYTVLHLESLSTLAYKLFKLCENCHGMEARNQPFTTPTISKNLYSAF